MTEFSTIHCNHFPACSGCQLQKDILSPPILSEIKKYFTTKGIPRFPLHYAETKAFRTRAKLAVRGTASSPQIGLFKKGTHEVLSILDCPLHHPSINQAIGIILDYITFCQIIPYNEQKLTGDLRYIQLAVERKTKKVQLVLVINSKNLHPSLQKFVQALSNHDLFHSIWVNFQSISTNTIFGKDWHLSHGERYLVENLAGNEIFFHPACFSQAHLSLFEKMLSSIQTMISSNQHIAEFYAGVGVIGLSLAEKAKKIAFCEINPFSKECFEKTKKNLPLEIQNKLSFHIGSSLQNISLLEDAEVIIVDPPRKGLEKEVLEKILSSPAKELLYVSCHFLSFQRDAEILLQNGWKIQAAEGYLMFPGTDHVEIVAKFEKISG